MCCCRKCRRLARRKIHESKGLEFPVVVLADIGKQFNLQDIYAPLLIHRELGLGPRRVDLEQSVRYPTFARQAIALRMAGTLAADVMAEAIRRAIENSKMPDGDYLAACRKPGK